MIAVGAAVLVAGTGYFAVQKTQEATGNFIEDKFSELLNKNLGKPHHIKSLENGFAEKATLTLSGYEGDKFYVDLAIDWRKDFNNSQEEPVYVQFDNTLVRGKTAFEGKDYGFGKIKTRIDSDKTTGILKFEKDPEMDSYIGLDGQVLSVVNMAAQKLFLDEDISVVVDGLKGRYEFDLKNPGSYQGHVQLEKSFWTFADTQHEMTLSPIKISSKQQKNEYSSTIDPFSLTDSNMQTNIGSIHVKQVKDAHNGYQQSVRMDGMQIKIILMDVDFNFSQLEYEGEFRIGDKTNEGKQKGHFALKINSTAQEENAQKLMALGNIQFNYDIQYKNLPNVWIKGILDNEEKSATTKLKAAQQAGFMILGDLALNTAQGNFSVHAEATLDEHIQAETDTEISLDKIGKQYVNVDKLVFTIDKSLVAFANIPIQFFVRNIKEENDKLIIEIKKQQDKVTLNGKEI